jgi:hypothetical protein
MLKGVVDGRTEQAGRHVLPPIRPLNKKADN